MTTTTPTPTTDRALLVAKIQLGFAILTFLIIIVGIVIRMSHLIDAISNTGILLLVIVALVYGTYEVGSAVILYKGIMNRSLKLVYIWWIFTFVVFVASLIGYIVDIFEDLPKTSVFSALMTIFDGVALKLVYDFIQEIRTTNARNEVPFSQMGDEDI